MPLFELQGSDKTKRNKKPRLGRYENIMRLLQQEHDPYKKFINFNDERPPEKLFKFIDLFSGAGGMTLGFSHAGFEPVASVELSTIASATHKRNFPNCKHFSDDITKFSPSQWLDSDLDLIHLVTGGPPCQGFSVAGKRDPNDPRNLLFRQFVRIVSEVRPWYVVMENVPGILTMQGGKVKEAIIEAFAEIGYPNMSVAVLEAAQFKIPQIRTRAIFIANRFGMVNPFPAPQLEPKDYLPIESAISDLPDYTPVPEINHEWTKHSKEYMDRLSKVPPGGSLYESYFDAFKRQYPGLPSMTIKENHGGTHIHPCLNRVISAREMARLQSFPDSFIFEGSMKKAMWQIGNAVPPRLAECLGLTLLPYLSAIMNNRKEAGDEVVTCNSKDEANCQMTLL